MAEENDQGKNNDVEAMAAALKKANEEAKNYRLQLKDANERIEKYSGAEQKVLKTQAELLLTRKGVKNPERLVDYLKLDGLDEDGLEGAIEQLETSLPEIFDPKSRAGDIDPGDRKPGKVEKTATDTLVKQILNR